MAKLEKRKGEENLIFSLEDDDGRTQEGTENIKQTVWKFYSNLYKNEPENIENQDLLLSKVDTFLTEEESALLDSPISLAELEMSLKNMQKSKTPGSNGLTREFISFFWNELDYFFFDLVGEIYEDESLCESQKK